MNLKISLILIILFCCCKSDKKQDKNSKEVTPIVAPKKEIKSVEETYYNSSAFVEAENLRPYFLEDSVKIIDFRTVKAYKKGHIPTAINISRNDIQNNKMPYRGVMADRLDIEKLLSNLGVSNNDTLIVYDDKGGSDAARFWWVLYVNGFTNVRLLNGGLNAWQAQNGLLTTNTPIYPKTQFKFPEQFRMPLIANRADVLKAIRTKSGVLIDTRTKDEFTGKRKKIGAIRAGHIPRAKLIDWADAIEYNATKKSKSVAELNALYGKYIKDKNDPVIVYCHSGVRSSYTTFVLTQLLGYNNVKNYDGSWIEWSYYKKLPIKQDSQTVIDK